MCGCGDLKYAKKKHSHPYVTQQQLDAAIDPLIDQDELDAGLGALDYYAQGQVDALIANLQSQIDDINQALIDCGCITAPCASFGDQFTNDISGWLIEAGDWELSHQVATGGLLKAERDNGASFQSFQYYTDLDVTYRDGMQLEVVAWSRESITAFEVWVYLDDPPQADVHELLDTVNTQWTTYQLDLSAIVSDGDKITRLLINAKTASSSTDYARMLIDSYEFTCP